MSTNEVDQLVNIMAKNLSALIDSKQISNPLMIGIHTGGVWLAEQLHKQRVRLTLMR